MPRIHAALGARLRLLPLRPTLGPTLGLALALALAACQQQPQEAAATGAAQPAPDAKPGASLSAGRLILPTVKGNPAAAYFTLTNSTKAPVTIAAVAVDGAGKAQMHLTSGGEMRMLDQVEVAPGAQLKFEPGSYHVMLFDLSPKLAAGAAAELTITFADGDKVSAPLTVEAAGGSSTGESAGMGEMHTGDMHTDDMHMGDHD